MIKIVNILKYLSILFIIPAVICLVEIFKPFHWNEIFYVRYGFFSLNIALLFTILLLFRNIEKKQFTKIDIGSTLLFSFFLAIILRILSNIIGAYGWHIDEIPKTGISKTSVLFPVSVLLLAPILEELATRIVIVNKFKECIPSWLLVLGTSLLFGILHIKNVNMVISSALTGVVLSYLFIKTQNALLLISTHFFINLFSYIPREYYHSSLVFALNNIWLVILVIFVLVAILIFNKEKCKDLLKKVSITE